MHSSFALTFSDYTHSQSYLGQYLLSLFRGIVSHVSFYLFVSYISNTVRVIMTFHILSWNLIFWMIFLKLVCMKVLSCGKVLWVLTDILSCIGHYNITQNSFTILKYLLYFTCSVYLPKSPCKSHLYHLYHFAFSRISYR